ncbi:MAG: FAD-binding protein [Pirellulales bacterium]|nr:FAD-binding protein [Pirellulales bacterium]
MRETMLPLPGDGQDHLPLRMVHTLVIGSGAAGLNAAVQLRAAGVDDVLIVTEGLDQGTSINTGSDKQTYYKLSLCGDEADAPSLLAQTFFGGGAMHGDLALVEASLSARAFLHLVNLGVPFPCDAYGQFAGYKTDHDPRRRATSIGPYTSREMCRALIRRVEERNIPVLENRVVVELITLEEDDHRRVAGCLAVDAEGRFEAFGAENVVFAAGGPGGLYQTSVYPAVHTGGIGLALAAGATAQNLPESQFGLASIAFRWNVSGTFMQVVPRVISTAADGQSDPREFLGEYFDSPGDMHSHIFLKGYQWPFDSRKVVGGSSIIDLLVYIETVLHGRRVFLDFRAESHGFRLEGLSDEARDYLVQSGATQSTPIDRLRVMNPAAIELYADHGIDITTEPLEIAVCAQHNNGGLAANHWWESVNLKHLFPVGEVNGSHGVYRPGGSALNSGQVGGFRAAEYIAARYGVWTVDQSSIERTVLDSMKYLSDWLAVSQNASTTWQDERAEFQARMSRAGAHVRQKDTLDKALDQAWRQVERIEHNGCRFATLSETAEALRNRQLALAHAVYLEAVRFAVASGTGSRGSAIVVDPTGERVHPKLDASWRIAPEDASFRSQVQETRLVALGQVDHRWVPCRPIPQSDLWFETAWARFRSGEIYDE